MRTRKSHLPKFLKESGSSRPSGRRQAPQRDPGNRAGQCGRGKRPQVRGGGGDRRLSGAGGLSQPQAEAVPQSSTGRAPTGKGKCKCSVPEIFAGKSPVCQQSAFPLAAKAGHQRQYATAKHAGQTAGNTAQAASKTGKAARTVKEKAQQAGAFVVRHKKGFPMAGVLFLITCMLMNTMSSCSMMAQSIGSVLSGTTYPSDDPEMLAVEADYAAREVQLQEEIDNIESSHPGYDEYRYDLGMIGHDPHELAAFLSAVLQGYTQQSASRQSWRVCLQHSIS